VSNPDISAVSLIWRCRESSEAIRSCSETVVKRVMSMSGPSAAGLSFAASAARRISSRRATDSGLS